MYQSFPEQATPRGPHKVHVIAPLFKGGLRGYAIFSAVLEKEHKKRNPCAGDLYRERRKEGRNLSTRPDSLIPEQVR